MKKKVVGQVTEKEKKQIQRLYERKNALAELAKIITAEDDALYEKIINDMGETNTKFQQWWDSMAQKYKWESKPNGRWEINFYNCEVYLHE